MARKSSFLQGFEVGADLYNKGFSQAMSLAQMKKQEDEKKYQRGRDTKADELAATAAAQRKKRLEMEIEEVKAARDERQRKQDNRKLANSRLDAFRSFVKDVNMDFSKPEDVRNMYEVLRTFRPEIDRDPEAKQALSGWLEGIEMTEGAKLIKWSEEEKKATLQYNVTQRLTKQAADSKLVTGFNNEWGTHYTTNDIAEVNKWRRQIKTSEDLALKTGTIDTSSFGDFEGFDKLSSHLDGIAATQQTVRTQKVEDAARVAALAEKQKEDWERTKQGLERQNVFTKFFEDKGIAGMTYNDPNSMREYRNMVQRDALTEDIEWDKVPESVVTMLATLPQLPNGGYSAETVAKFKAQVAKFEGGEIRRRIPKTEEAGKGVLYSESMLFHGKIMKQIEAQGMPGTAGFWDSYIMDGTLGKLGNYALDARAQQYKNAADNFIAGVLRKESGAAITEQERKDYWPQYIPVPGDKPELIAQKKAARENFMQATRAVTGMTWDDTADTRVDPPPVPFATKQDVKNAISQGLLKKNDSYAYYDSDGNTKVGKVVTGATESKRLPDSPSGSVSDVQVDPSWPSEPVPPSGVDGFGNTPMKIPPSMGMEYPQPAPEAGEEIESPASGVGKELLPELEEAPTPEDNQFEEDAREATRWAPHASSEAVMDESQDKPAIPPLPRGNHDEWRAQLRTMAEKRGGTTNAAKMSRPFVGLNITGGSIKGVITAQDEPGVWIGKPSREQRFLPWSEVIKLIDQNQIQPGNSAPEEHEGPDAVDEVIKSLGSKKDALMKVLGDEKLRKKALEELRKRLKK